MWKERQRKVTLIVYEYDNGWSTWDIFLKNYETDSRKAGKVIYFNIWKHQTLRQEKNAYIL